MRSASMRVFDEINLELTAQQVRHGLLDALVCDGLLRLVFVGGDVREGGDHEDQAVLHIGKCDLALVLVVLVVLLEPGVNLAHERAAGRFVRRAAVLQPAGIVIVFELVDAVGEGERHIDLRLVLRLVGAVAHASALPARTARRVMASSPASSFTWSTMPF